MTRARALRVLLAGLALVLAWPAAPEAQPAKPVRLGLMATGPTFSDGSPMLAAFRQGLAERGWVEGKNVELIRRTARGDRAYFLANSLLSLGVDLIVTASTIATRIAQEATSTVPIVFIGVSDPLGSGVVASLEPPRGTNLVGLTDVDVRSSAQSLALLKEAAPAITRVALVVNPDAPRAPRYAAEVEIMALSLGITVHRRVVRQAEDLPTSLAAILKEYDQAVVVLPDPLFNALRDPLIEFAARYRLPAVYGYHALVSAGGLMSYGTDLPDLYRRAAGLVDRVLRGAAPGDLRIEGPAKFHLAINLKTAERLRLTVPESLRSQADQLVK